MFEIMGDRARPPTIATQTLSARRPERITEALAIAKQTADAVTSSLELITRTRAKHGFDEQPRKAMPVAERQIIICK